MNALKTRAGALIALALGVVLFGIVVVTPVVAAFSAQQGETEDALQQLGYFRAEIAAKPELEAELAALNERGASVPGVIESASTALAQAQLQSRIKSIVESKGGSIRSMQILPAAKQGGFEVIAVQCDLQVPMGRLQDLAYAVDSHAPYLFVDEASISAPPGEPDDIQNHQPMLDIRWTVHGYRWGRAK
jgi:general secretion pathway protein M